MLGLLTFAAIALALAAPAQAGCVEVGRGEGEVRAALTRAELTAEERALVEERFGPDFLEAEQLGLDPEGLFDFARCELNGSEPPELVAIGRSPAHCMGAVHGGRRPVCGVWALARTSQGWVQVLETAGRARLAPSTTNGWRDFVLERGAAPRVWKFGGAVYQEDIGPAAPTPETLEDFGGYGVGPGEIAWYAFDDPMPQAVEDAFLWFYAAEIRAPGGRVGVLPDEFRVGVADLDRRGTEDAVIQGITPALCGPEGCEHWVLTGLETPPPHIAARLRGFDLQAAATGGAGGRDLIAQGPDGLRVWRNDGDGWDLPGVSR